MLSSSACLKHNAYSFLFSLKLKQEKSANKRLERELKLALETIQEQQSLSQRQRTAAAHLIKDRRRLLRELTIKCQQLEQLGIRSSATLEAPSVTESEVSFLFPFFNLFMFIVHVSLFRLFVYF